MTVPPLFIEDLFDDLFFCFFIDIIIHEMFLEDDLHTGKLGIVHPLLIDIAAIQPEDIDELLEHEPGRNDQEHIAGNDIAQIHIQRQTDDPAGKQHHRQSEIIRKIFLHGPQLHVVEVVD